MKHLFALLQRSGFEFLNFVLLLALCAMAAKWTWVFLAPVTVAIPENVDISTKQAAESIIADHLLAGKAAIERPPPDLKLEGVFAVEGGDRGIAIFQSTGKSMIVPLKGQVMSGMMLDAIYKDHVVLDRNGAKARLNLEENPPPVALQSAR
ncbi:MAG: type II secretion system protein N [Sulfuriferula sp.]